MTFYAALKNNPDSRLKCAELLFYETPVINDDVYDEVIKILLHAQQWEKWERQAEVNYLIECDLLKKNGYEPNSAREYNLSKMQYPRELLLRPNEIGFDLNELIPFLNAQKITHTLELKKEANIKQSSAVNNQDDIKTDGEQNSAGNIEGNTKGNNERVSIPKNDKPRNHKHRELKQWLYETWINENMPEGKDFFITLKKYKGLKGSPIIDHYSAGDDAGIKWRTSAGYSDDMAKKTIQNKVSEFKKTYSNKTLSIAKNRQNSL